MGSSTFTTPAGAAIHQSLTALTVVTVGDLLYVGEGYRARIRERTFAGIDVNGNGDPPPRKRRAPVPAPTRIALVRRKAAQPECGPRSKPAQRTA